MKMGFLKVFVTFILAAAFASVIPATAQASAKICGINAMRREVARLSDSAHVETPKVKYSRSSYYAWYEPASKAIMVNRCATPNVLAHEFGHHVSNLAGEHQGGSVWTASKPFKKGPNWLTTSNDPDGVERSAHCIAYLLGARGPFTRCPVAASLKAAKVLLIQAREVVVAATPEEPAPAE